jgi:anhydro-N-acetylmuramic acid kinase
MSKKAFLKDILASKKKLVVGLNSGTSANGIDAAIIEVEGSGLGSRVRFIAGKTYPFSKAVMSEIKRYAEPDFKDGEKWLELDAELADRFSRAVIKISGFAGLDISDVDLIGSHGQTIRHRPETKYGALTLQLADPARIAVKTGVLTVGDFRIADTAAGGQGAPLTPIVNGILFHNHDKEIAVLNIGGIANITVISPEKQGIGLFGCDTGPGNMLVDYLVQTLFSKRYDRAGKIALKGRINNKIVKSILSRGFFSIKGPKSTGREAFGKQFGSAFRSMCRNKGMSKYDIIATASMLTVEAVKRCVDINKLKFEELIIAGGGAGNGFFMSMLGKALPFARIVASSDHGYPEAYLEAVSFAILANEALCSNRYDLKNVTGAGKAVVPGKICQP